MAADPAKRDQPAEPGQVPPAVSPAPPTPDSPAPAETVAAVSGLEPVEVLFPATEIIPLLVKAVGMLPDGERDQVYAWLLERGLGGPLGSSAVLARQLRSRVMSLEAASVLSAGHQTAQQVVPIRFPADQHAALRGWCAEHGFSMATVIRGLVSRFLEGQHRAQGT